MKVRPMVQQFAERMEKALREHDSERGEEGWRDEDEHWLLARLHEEVAELEKAFDERASRSDARRERIVAEAADVANFAMMIADVI